jgi:hypothetical protein
VDLNMQAVSLVFERFSFWQTQWLFFYTVAGALLTLLASGKLTQDSWRVRLAISVIFFLFAFGHVRAMRDIQEQRSHLTEAVLNTANLKPFHQAVMAAEPPTKSQVTWYHLGMDALIIGLIWLIPRPR